MKKIIVSTLKAAVILLTTAFISYSCSKDGDEDYTFAFSSPALYFNYGETQTLPFTKSGNVKGVSVSSTPAGWTAELDAAAGTVKITAPDSLDDTTDDSGKTVTPVEYGTLVLRGTVGEKTVSASLYISMSDVVDLSGVHANSFILTRTSTGYRISATRPDGSAVEGIASVNTVWTSERYLIRYVEYKNGKITFTTYSDGNDFTEGNALIAAYDDDDNVLWCWHLWVTKNNPADNAVQLNGHTFMGCNLGALGNSAGSDSKILASYGLYYQWGRPTPFPRPRYYDCADGTSESLYSATVSSVSMSVEELDDANGTMQAAVSSPLIFVTGLKSPWSGAGDQPWNDSAKTNYDPCPAGWRVPASNAFDGLAIAAEELADELAALKMSYGWTLTDGTQSAFFFAGGRRSYMDGNVINMNTQETPLPWEGFYWTSSLDTSRQTAAGMYFDLDTVDAAQSSLQTARSLQLSNGLQVRCVKEQ